METLPAHKLQRNNRIMKDGRELVVAAKQDKQNGTYLFSLRDNIRGTEGLHLINKNETFEIVPARQMVWIDGKAATTHTLTEQEAHDLAAKYSIKAHRTRTAMLIEVTAMNTDDSRDGEQIVFAMQVDEEGREMCATDFA